MERILSLNRFYGGFSEDLKDGLENSYFWGRSLDFRSEPSVIKILPKTAKESGSEVDGMVRWFEPVGTDMYSYADNGDLYKRTSAGSWSTVGTFTTSSGNGLAYFPLDDFLYCAKDKVIGRYGPISGTPALTQDYFSDGTVDLDQFLDTSGQVYNVPTSITENATNRQDFTPLRDPQKSVQINVSAVGSSADWTVTVHDGSNNSIATETIANASMSTGDVTFTFDTPWRPVIGATYHFHVTVTNTTGTPAVVTGTASDLNDVDFHTFYQILVDDTEFHPAVEFNGLLCVGNERYVATYNGIDKAAGSSVYNPHAVVLPAGWKVRDLEKVGEYLAIVAVRSHTVTNFNEGLIAFWDGTESNYNFYLYVGDATITAAFAYGSTLYYIDTTGTIWAWFNGEVQKVKQIPKMTQQTYLDVFPGAFGAWQGVLRIGVAGNSDSTTVQKGVYSYGRTNDLYPRALSFDYPTSTGELSGTTLKIGAVGKIGDTLFISWDDDGTYGVDVVTDTANPFTSAYIETRLFDDGRPEEQKKARQIKVTHTPLISGQSVRIGYDADRSGTYTQDTANSTADTKETVFDVGEVYFYELQTEVLLNTTSSNQIKVTSISLLYDDLAEEEIFRAG